MRQCVAASLLLQLLPSAACQRGELAFGAGLHRPDATLGIERVPAVLGEDYVSAFDRYTKVTAPGGGAIHIVAQSRITNEQIVRARNVLEHFLRDLPGSTYGADKSAIADAMAENSAILLLLNGRDDGRSPVDLPGQLLFEEEIQVEGHEWYIGQQYGSHGDATFEEILHLVHDYGIGVDGHNSLPGAGHGYQAEIRVAQENALSSSLWGLGASEWIAELTEENSLSQEYLASVVDSYYGLWSAWSESETHGMWGVYTAKTRDELSEEDPMGWDVVSGFFHPTLTYNARVDSSFDGVFEMRYDPDITYTGHSQYLTSITLTGSKYSGVSVNGHDNDITGNRGVNIVVFSGHSGEYTITRAGTEVIVSDQVAGRDGTNTLRDIEQLEFTDRTVAAF